MKEWIYLRIQKDEFIFEWMKGWSNISKRMKGWIYLWKKNECI